VTIRDGATVICDSQKCKSVNGTVIRSGEGELLTLTIPAEDVLTGTDPWNSRVTASVDWKTEYRWRSLLMEYPNAAKGVK
jgi:hypothetical protein